jgi:RNA polymerase sigma-70 factor, ECF subfamily
VKGDDEEAAGAGDEELLEELGARRRRGESSVPDSAALVEDAYLELRSLAERLLAGERADHTLQPTALVHEAWLRIGDDDRWNDRTHFFATAARAMRRVLVDHARGKGRAKRGGNWKRVDLDSADVPGPGADLAADQGVDLVALDHALEELEQLSPRQARVVELRFFAGLEMDVVAQVLAVSPATVARDWRFARAWMARALEGS